ncbi:hypothetical protein [Aureimonas leprariae]|uniref:Uncharacterized protein n=1 Tax=Plantimonas leprariae TaxID=2615207 RepID=A0A7V7PQC1_9HYPH|nr:hypothetical protein [Aureimonas leprariae]KAB0680321.1 hypothetical protein F6X38_09095 [Aureimonas leprariae]
MSTIEVDRHTEYRRRRREEAREYWLIFCLIYPQLLVVAVVRRLLALFLGRPPAPGEPRRSVFTEARVGAASCIPFAFK